MEPVLSEAREKLKELTPLKADCGRVCGARCCAPLEGEETGMLLFPGEAEAYAGRSGIPPWDRSRSVREHATGRSARLPAGCFRCCPCRGKAAASGW